jgi:ribonucleoside-diphosphate reductase beta chain
MADKKNDYEILTDPKMDRNFLIPIQFQDIWDMKKKHEATTWNAQEIDFTKDKEDWKKLKEEERYFIEHILAFFAASDKIVVTNLQKRFIDEITIPEAIQFYQKQADMENVHTESYNLMIDILIEDKTKKFKLLNAIEEIDCVKRKGEWAKRWIDSPESLDTRLIAFAIVEGIFFSGSFCAIYWLAEKGVMKALHEANDFISRDEGLHTDFAVLLHNEYIRNKISQDRFNTMLRDAVKHECDFITKAIPCTLLGMNANDMVMYIKYCANRLAKQLGYDKVYNKVRQPFPFMDRMCYASKSNFFERRPTEYQMIRNDSKDDAFADL